MNHTPTAAEVRAALDYNPETGVLTRNPCLDRLGRRNVRDAGKIAGTAGGKDCYVRVKIFGRMYKAHRLAWLIIHGHWPDGEIDHINGIRNDNRLCNLRDVSRAVNMQNQRRAHRGSKSPLLGVSQTPTGKWLSQIGVNGKKVFLGIHRTEEEAHIAYMKGKEQLHTGYVSDANQ